MRVLYTIKFNMSTEPYKKCKPERVEIRGIIISDSLIGVIIEIRYRKCNILVHVHLKL